jgi:hypothetical protein
MKLVLLVSTCTVQTTHSTTRPLDRWPPSTQLVRSPPVLCIRSSTPVTILITTCYVAPITYTSKHDSPNEPKDKGKATKISWIRIQTSATQ